MILKASEIRPAGFFLSTDVPAKETDHLGPRHDEDHAGVRIVSIDLSSVERAYAQQQSTKLIQWERPLVLDSTSTLVYKCHSEPQMRSQCAVPFSGYSH